MSGLLGPCVRRILPRANEPERLYVTFDDGPHSEFTPRVLDTLDRHGARATFFVVAERARHHRSLLEEIRHRGHAIGNHSLDHTYAPFFASRRRLLEWVRSADGLLTDLIGEAPIGFRSPAGVRTPPLHWALRELDLPLVHWSVRFYDTRFLWKRDHALRSLSITPPGAIVLLHDTHEGKRAETFLSTLDAYLARAKQRKELASLTRESVGRALPAWE